MTGDFLNSIKNNRVIKNASWLVFGKVIQMAISFFIGLLVARYLGPTNYGVLNYAGAYTSFFIPICNLGVNSILVRELMEFPDSQGETIGSTLCMRAVSSILSAVAIVSFVALVDADEQVTIIVVALSTLSLVFQIIETFNYWFQSRLESKASAIAILFAYISTSIYRLILVLLQADVVWFAAVSCLDYLMQGIVLISLYRSSNGQKLKVTKKRCKQLIASSHYFILPSMMVALYGQCDRILLKQIIGETEVGYYSIAIGLCNVWCFVLSAIIDSAYPVIMDAHKRNEEIFKTRNKQLYATIFYISVIVSVMFCVLADPIIKLLYGSQYLPAIAPLRIVTWYTAFSYLGSARDAWVVIEGKQRYLKYIYGVAAIGNVILNVALIPLWGASGSALASLLTQITTVFIAPAFIQEMRPNVRLMVDAIFLNGVWTK